MMMMMTMMILLLILLLVLLLLLIIIILILIILIIIIILILTLILILILILVVIVMILPSIGYLLGLNPSFSHTAKYHINGGYPNSIHMMSQCVPFYSIICCRLFVYLILYIQDVPCPFPGTQKVRPSRLCTCSRIGRSAQFISLESMISH